MRIAQVLRGSLEFAKVRRFLQVTPSESQGFLASFAFFELLFDSLMFYGSLRSLKICNSLGTSEVLQGSLLFRGSPRFSKIFKQSLVLSSLNVSVGSTRVFVVCEFISGS